VYYCWRTKASTEVAENLEQLWPNHYLYWELWRWNFDRYIVHQELAAEMMEFIAEEMENPNLDAAVFREILRREQEKATKSDSQNTQDRDQS
jgi:hypothetical protein